MKLFRRELLFWSVVTTWIALPSVLIVFSEPFAGFSYAAVAFVIAVSILAAAAITSARFYQPLRETLLHQSLILALKIRAGFTLASLFFGAVFLFDSDYGFLLFMPEAWTGLAATGLCNLLTLLTPAYNLDVFSASGFSFLETLPIALLTALITVLEILFLSFAILIIKTLKKNRSFGKSLGVSARPGQAC